MINLTNDERWMLYALKEANKALKMDEVPIGAIIINEDNIIALTGFIFIKFTFLLILEIILQNYKVYDLYLIDILIYHPRHQ